MRTCGSQGTMSHYTIHGAQGVTTTRWIFIVYNLLQSGDNVDDRERGSFLYDTSRLTRSAVFIPICDEMPVLVCSSLLAYFP